MGSARPLLCTTYEGNDPALLERVLPLVDFIEVTPDSIAEIRGDTAYLRPSIMAELKNASSVVNIIVHGVGLSIGSHEGYSQRYIRLLDSFLEQIDVVWHSEHLGYTMVDGEQLGTMLALPKTEAVLDMICERVQEIQERYHKPFLLENVVHILPDYPSAYSEAAFLNQMTERTGCGLIIDVYNLECDAHNHAFDLSGFFDELNFTPAREIHLAGGVEHQQFMLDIHSRTTAASTVDLAKQVLQKAENSVEVVTYELLAEAVPALGYDRITNELIHLRKSLLS
jgi:uncharacterized protein (UPF0276 family)